MLAERIEDEIIAAGWPVGSAIGSESELLERYGVSRAVFREAIRIVNHHGVAAMRRGPGGGLVVATPDLDAMVRAVTLQLRYATITPDQVNEARRCARGRVRPAGDEAPRRRRTPAPRRLPRGRGGAHHAHAQGGPPEG